MKESLKLERNEPAADVLSKSIRSMGYSLESAIADVIDNSISAGAHDIQVKFPVDPNEVYIAICDNGSGMNKAELFDAMKYGSVLKGDNRSESDLGRFGMGLKSASHSQCRRLTVISKKSDMISGYVWDLDLVDEKKDWIMINLSENQVCDVRHYDYLSNKKSGTVVVWENFDFIRKETGDEYAGIVDQQNAVSDYLSLIFHRFLSKDKKDRLSIKVNNFSLIPFDPFLESHKKTTVRKEITLPIEDANGVERKITAIPYVLPFQKDLSEEDKKLSGGIENYRTKQGYYIYRNERLIVWGTWFNRHRDELSKYARVKVDIPNTLDDIWGIDIKKQSAKIPASIRQRLNRAVDDVMDVAVKKQTYRGRIAKVNDDFEYVWNRIDNRGNFVYSINRESSLFKLLESKVNEDAMPYVEMVLKEIEQNVPFQQIYVDKSQDKIDEVVSDERIAEITENAKMMVQMVMELNSSLTREEAVENVFKKEPFCKHPEIKEKV